ncbi:hypothetical protein K491DRAFT_784935 [Lophiostoma macrostomum CBS 122681]|uniref:Uncharacterized protein n=1 Tax=Lophiostoma macrostomum CBS 122681 TaxID=1314788 RepID=A0A6A6SJA2_9PLEO|nr:hypothetical protein K491DRAFT_784935 [Lophiostoma macrostomum CBS 122681]
MCVDDVRARLLWNPKTIVFYRATTLETNDVIVVVLAFVVADVVVVVNSPASPANLPSPISIPTRPSSPNRINPSTILTRTPFCLPPPPRSLTLKRQPGVEVATPLKPETSAAPPLNLLGGPIGTPKRDV